MPKDSTVEPHLPIGAVERETGLPKDTLRVWERRYGFPAPERDESGERAYSPADVAKLRLIKRLIDQGHRPGKLITASHDKLAALLRPTSDAPDETHCQRLLALVRMQTVDELRAQLGQTLMQQGLVRFVCETLAPLNRLVGEAWLRGEVQVHEEHFYSELVTNMLRGAIGQQAARGRPPRVLLTTVADEEHGLGLLMAEALMTAEGANCVSLGTRTPLVDIRSAIEDGRFDALALSFSTRCSTRIVTESLNTLRQLLPGNVEIWAGGAGVRQPDRLSAGITVIPGIAQAVDLVRDWRSRNPA